MPEAYCSSFLGILGVKTIFFQNFVPSRVTNLANCRKVRETSKLNSQFTVVAKALPALLQKFGNVSAVRVQGTGPKPTREIVFIRCGILSLPTVTNQWKMNTRKEPFQQWAARIHSSGRIQQPLSDPSNSEDRYWVQNPLNVVLSKFLVLIGNFRKLKKNIKQKRLPN